MPFFNFSFFLLTSSLRSLWIIGWLFYFNSHWFCYLDSFVWWRVFMHIILISGALELRAIYVFSDKRDRERNFTISLLHWNVYTIWRTELFFRFPCEIVCVCVQDTIYCVFANEMTYSFRRRMSTNTHSHMYYIYKTHVHVWMLMRDNGTSMYLLLLSFSKWNLQKCYWKCLVNSLYLIHSHMSIAPLVQYCFSSFLFSNS